MKDAKQISELRHNLAQNECQTEMREKLPKKKKKFRDMLVKKDQEWMDELKRRENNWMEKVEDLRSQLGKRDIEVHT